MRVLRIPDEEKAKGMMWVIYPIIDDRGSIFRHVAMTADSEIIGYVELQIRQGKN